MNNNPLEVWRIARICHDINKCWCEYNDDHSQVSWAAAPLETQLSAVNGVEFVLANPLAGDAAQHNNWSKSKIEAGWVWGLEKSETLKTHPCLVEFEDLPKHQQFKDQLFRAVVLAAKGL